MGSSMALLIAHLSRGAYFIGQGNGRDSSLSM